MMWDSFGPILAELALLFVLICLIEVLACEVPVVFV